MFASPKESVSFALHSVAGPAFFSEWYVDHPYQDHLGFSLQAYCWVHTSDVLNKNLCEHSPGICNKLRVDHCAPDSAKSAASNSCPEHVLGPHPPILLALGPTHPSF